ncbi:hypothetical protein ACKVMT_11515 [Halobacteriales archaeon Cl-PHB]
MPTQTVESIGVASLARILALMGLLWGGILSVTWLAAGLLGSAAPGLSELLVLVLLGVVYGAIGGVVTAILYNAAASLIGGLELTLE